MKLLKKKVEGHKYAVGSGNSAVPAIFGSLGSSRRLPSYNLLVNFASLLEGYVRWDKKYLEWYPGPTIASTPPFSFSSLSPRSCYQHSLSLCATSTADSIPGAASSSISSNGGAPPWLVVGLEYQSCLHRATGLHHWLRRSANHRQPPLSSCSPSLSLSRSLRTGNLLLLADLLPRIWISHRYPTDTRPISTRLPRVPFIRGDWKCRCKWRLGVFIGKLD